MPEINKDSQISKQYWGNTKAADIENKKFVNVGLDIVNGSDIAQQFAEQNINFFAHNNEMLSVANIIVNSSDYAKAMDIVKNATHKLMPNMEFKDNFFGNTNYANIPDKKIMIIGNEASSKLQLNKLLNDNNISFSAREFAVNQVTAITINKADSERVESLIRNALNPIQHQEQNQEHPVQQNNQQPKHSKITVSSDLRAKIGQELLNNDIAFSTNVDTVSKTATFTVNTQDMPLLNEIMMNISKEAVQENIAEKENIVNESIEEAAPKGENTVAQTQETSETAENTVENKTAVENVTEEIVEEAEEEPIQPMELTETIQALREMADKKRINLEDISYRPPVARAYDLLSSINTNTFKIADDSREVKAAENIPIDFGEKISPVFKLSMANHEAALNRIFEKNDTLNAKIEKNQTRIEALNNRIDTLQHNNSLLTAIKNAVPFANGIADKLIEQNNKEIKNITEDKIPKREQKIEKHKGKIEKNNVSISETMKSLKQISAVNKFITSFKSMNADERRDSFINGLTAIANISVNNAFEKRDKAVTRLKDIAETFNSTERTPLTVISAQNDEMIKLTSIIEKQQNKIEKAFSLINNLERVLNGELLQNKVDEVIETTENAVATEIASANISESTEITGENLTDTIVGTASKVISSAVEQEQQEIINEQEAKSAEQIENSAEMENPIKHIEETIEVNDNHIDGIINNLPTEKEHQPEPVIEEQPVQTEQEKDEKEVSEKVVELLADIAFNDEGNSFFNEAKNETVIVREERPENPEPVVTVDKEQKILNEIAAATGFSASQLDSLPKDIKADIIAEYEFNGDNINSEAFTAEMASILNVEPPKIDNSQPKPELPREEKEQSERNNHSKAADNEVQQQQEKKSRFSVKDLHSERYAPRSHQNEKDRQNTQNRNGMEL